MEAFGKIQNGAANLLNKTLFISKQTKLMARVKELELKTVLRILHLMRELRKRPLTITQMLEYFDQQQDTISRSTVNRYIKVYRKLKLKVVRIKQAYFIDDKESARFTIDDMIEEEKVLLCDLLMPLPVDNPLRNNLLKRLTNSQNDLTPLVDSLVRLQDIENINAIVEAIRTKKRIILRGYQSTNSYRQSERLVEPKRFIDVYQKAYCYEVDTKKMKTFHIERISSIETLEVDQQFDPPFERLDVFGWSGFEEHQVELRLTNRARLIMEKEYPATRDMMRDDSGGLYRIRTFYTHFEGVSRFILSLVGEVEVLNSERLKKYLNQQLERLKNKCY